ncbi:cytochrome b5 reductase 4-like [Lycorma delicatula]|uniref:cytochrome b5 reductase 4-like n=1 Tax=Lycorma delicatula TaxID=130591 RepID=UPI003F51897D
MGMEAVQILTAITVYYPTTMMTPKIHLELINETVLHTWINKRVQFHQFGGPVVWPGNISVTKQGLVTMVFKKRVPENWTVPLAPMNVNYTNANVPQVWNYRIIKKVKESRSCYIFTLRPSKRMYFHLNIGHYIGIIKIVYKGFHHIKHTLIHQYSPIPNLPLVSLHDPNPPPGAFKSMNMNLNIAVRITPKRSFGYWLNSLPDGADLNVTYPYGTVFLPMFSDVGHLHLVTSGTAVTAVFEILIYLLQMSRIKGIQLLVFNTVEKEVVFRDALTNLTRFDKRLTVRQFVARPTVFWRGLRGTVSRRIIKTFIPEYDNNITKTHYCGICGYSKFTKKVESTSSPNKLLQTLEAASLEQVFQCTCNLLHPWMTKPRRVFDNSITEW